MLILAYADTPVPILVAGDAVPLRGDRLSWRRGGGYDYRPPSVCPPRRGLRPRSSLRRRTGALSAHAGCKWKGLVGMGTLLQPLTISLLPCSSC